MIIKGVVTSLFVLLFSQAPCRAEILTCVGPKGELYFTDRQCPAGFSLNAAVPETPRSAGKASYEDDWPLNCRSISVMTADEVAAAIASVERVLLSLSKAADPRLLSRWEACHSQLRERKSALAPAPPAGAAQPLSRPGDVDRTDPICRLGEFSTENGGSSYDVYFTNLSGRGCALVKAYCLCSLSFGAYRQSKDIAVAGSFAPGERTRIASISPTGPSGGGIDWSWCKFRR